jgi:hypothetical protein
MNSARETFQGDFMKKHLLIGTALLVVYATGLIVFTGHRPIDGDEGFYATATALVIDGRVPYSDFFYPQMPILPYIYAPAEFVAGHSIVALRVFSAILSIIAVFLWAAYLRKQHGETPWIALAALSVLLLNPSFISWNVTVKTFASANLFTTLVLLGVWQAQRTGKASWYLGVGTALGLLVEVRLMYLPVVAVILGWLIVRAARSGQGKSEWESVWNCTLGVVFASMPAILQLLNAPRAFFFNNFAYHSIRAVGKIPSFASRLIDVPIYFGRTLIQHPALLILLVLAIAGTWAILKRKITLSDEMRTFAYILITCAGVFLITSMTPFPLYQQYFTSPLVPFLFPLAAFGLVWLSETFTPWSLAAILFVLIPILPMNLHAENQRNSRGGMWRPQTTVAVARMIAANTPKDAKVLAFWPGYIYESGRKHYPGMENHFALGVSPEIPPVERREFHIPSLSRVMALVRGREAEAVIYGGWMKEMQLISRRNEIPYLKMKLRQNYRMVGVIGGAELYLRRTKALPPQKGDFPWE